jgi:hypothetical protein
MIALCRADRIIPVSSHSSSISPQPATGRLDARERTVSAFLVHFFHKPVDQRGDTEGEAAQYKNGSEQVRKKEIRYFFDIPHG